MGANMSWSLITSIVRLLPLISSFAAQYNVHPKYLRTFYVISIKVDDNLCMILPA